MMVLSQLNKLKTTTFLLVSGTILLFSSLSTHAMEEDTPPGGTHPSPLKEGEKVQAVRYVTARERLNLVKSYYEAYPDLTMTTPVTKLYEELYLKDLAFIIQEVEKRKNKEVIKRELQDFDLFVQGRYSTEMSFADYNYIGMGWTWILSNKDKEYNPKHLDFLTEEYDNALNIFKKHKQLPGSPLHFKYIQAPGIVLPHGSNTGSVPILVLNDGFGFFMNDEIPHSVDFLATGTDLELDFDYLKKQTCSETWYHDYEHLIRAERFSPDTKYTLMPFALRTKNIANLRKEIKKLANLTKPTSYSQEELMRRYQAELAFFDIFHESQQSMLTITEELNKRAASAQEKLVKTEPSQGFNSIEQYGTYVHAAKSLNLPMEGESLIEQYKSYLRHLLAGYETLKQIAPAYDEYYYQIQQELADQGH